MINAAVLIAEGFEEIEATISIDILRRAGLNVTVVSVTGNGKIVEGARKTKIQPDITLKEYKEIPDALILPGGMPGAKNLAESEKVTELINKINNDNKLIAAICASPSIVLSPLGILDNKKATCYPGFQKQFSNTTTYIDKKVVLDKNIITSQGPGTAFTFALGIIKYLLGAEKASTVEKQALIE